MSLPPRFFLRKDPDPSSPFHVLVKTYDGEFPSFRILKHTNDAILHAVPKEGSLTSFRRMCVRQHSDGPHYIESMFCYSGSCVTYENQEIPIWDMINTYKLLPRAYKYLEQYPMYQFLIYKSALTPTQRAIRTFCETHKEDVCPITMNRFDEATTALTPCGHGFEKHAIQQWLQTHTMCPVCRRQVQSTDISVN